MIKPVVPSSKFRVVTVSRRAKRRELVSHVLRRRRDATENDIVFADVSRRRPSNKRADGLENGV